MTERPTQAGLAGLEGLAGTSALITGASSGLGVELARQLAAGGGDVALCARRLDRLEALAAELRGAYPERRVIVRELDVDNASDVVAAFTAVRTELGTIDRVVVNAGRAGGAALGTGDAARNRAITVTNYLGALAQTEAAVEIFRAQGHGHLVLFPSMAALRGLPGSLAASAPPRPRWPGSAPVCRSSWRGPASPSRSCTPVTWRSR